MQMVSLARSPNNDCVLGWDRVGHYTKVSQARIPAEIMRFNFRYLCMFVFMFIVELIIAIFINDSFIRPFLGDVFVIMFIYLFIRIFFICEKFKLVIAVLVFSYLVEIGQYFDLISILHLQDNAVAQIVIGSTFDVMDLLAYSVGAFLLMLPNMRFSNKAIDSKVNTDGVN